MGCGCGRKVEMLVAPDASPVAYGQLKVDRAGLRAALGGRAEVIEANAVKATGRPGVNASRMWAFMTASVYQSGDLPVLATREALQNGVDAIKAAVRARQTRAGTGRFEVRWDAAQRALTWEDNGIGMDADTILTKFLSLGDSGKRDAGDSGEAAGGFGVAKAVILGTSSTFRWEMHTRDNLAVSKGANEDVEVFDAPFRQGTRITIFDVSPEYDLQWDYARQAWVPLIERLRELLGANDLPEVTLVLDGEEVGPLFSRRGGAKVSMQGSWGTGATAAVKAYRRPPGDRSGGYYVRLGGLFQFKLPNQRGNLKADVVVDLLTTVRPGMAGYPLNAGRDALQDRARYALLDLVHEVERENESVGRSEEDEVFDPDAADDDERRGGQELGNLVGDAFADAEFRRALNDAAGGIADYYAERAKDPGVKSTVDSAAPAGSRSWDEERPTRTVPAGLVAGAGDDDPVARLRRLLTAADDDSGRVLTDSVDFALREVATGRANGGVIGILEDAVDRAATRALLPGHGGLLEVGALHAQTADVLDQAFPERDVGRRAPRRNPFGRLAGLRISKKNYDRQRAYRFRKGFARWIGHLTAWDATLRLIAGEAGIRREFKPGFVLNDEVLGMAATSGPGIPVIYVHPDRLEQVIKAHRERPLAIAAYLHGVAVHELTHVDGRMGDGHDEAFVAAREDLGAATGHLLPAIAVLVQRVLKLPVKPTAEQKLIATLQRDLARLRAARGDHKKAIARVEAELLAARRELAAAVAESERVRAECAAGCGTCACSSDAATTALEAVVEEMRRAPPPGVTVHEIDGFVSRNRVALLQMLTPRARPVAGGRG